MNNRSTDWVDVLAVAIGENARWANRLQGGKAL
jgi:hypothetical protein